ncbi:MAG: DUF1707 domain-containing protein [Nocardiopsaceae bacterium]|nr:DUF1707 domain-containing protein [Nocardiopsaceae bacterium]
MGGEWMRAADWDREAIMEILREAYAEGRLDQAELDERTDAALRARTLGELRRLTADIPPPAPGADRSSAAVRPGELPLVRRVVSLSALMLAGVFACVVIGAAARNIMVVALAVIVGSAIAIRRG